MQKTFSVLTLIAFAFILCSMSRCREDKTPGPLTTVRGVIKDAVTGETRAGIVLQVMKEYSRGLYAIDSGPGYSDYDTVVTQANGTYNLTFTPIGTGRFYLVFKSGAANTFPVDYNSKDMVLGSTNEFNMRYITLLNVSIHLKNNTDHGRKSFRFEYKYDQAYVYFNTIKDFNKPLLDTTFSIKLPHLSKNALTSLFWTGYIPSGPNVGTLADTLTFKTTLLTGKKDTAITIINP